MFRNKIIIPLSLIYFVFIILGNMAIVVVAYVYNQDYYWALLLSVPPLLFVVYKTHRRSPGVLPARVVYHSPVLSNKNKLTVVIGNEQCRKRRLSSIFTVGIFETLQKKVYPMSMENGIDERQESDELITTLNLTGGYRIWRIEPDYKGCRLKNGQFSSEMFKTNVSSHDIKAIEITLSLLTLHVNDINLNDQAQTKIQTSGSNGINSYYGYSGFYNADGMIHFIESLRELSGGKPVGFKIGIHDKKEFQKICYAIRKTQIIPDFVVVEGFEKQNNLANLDITNKSGMALYEALQFVSSTLKNYGLDKQILIIAKANITSGFDILKALALGAHAVRTVMPGKRIINPHDIQFSNIDSISHYSPVSPLSVFHEKIIEDTARAMEYLGFKSTKEMSPASFFRRLFVLEESKNKGNNDLLLESNPSKILVGMSSPITSEQPNTLFVK